ncbi:hypothetical protein [Halobellus sp. GM3]|uniref:hypothetical protein n=1 Tax=Halobellus sp. GM3 TaxID=3458410 RepID=UPI00403DC93B
MDDSTTVYGWEGVADEPLCDVCGEVVEAGGGVNFYPRPIGENANVSAYERLERTCLCNTCLRDQRTRNHAFERAVAPPSSDGMGGSEGENATIAIEESNGTSHIYIKSILVLLLLGVGVVLMIESVSKPLLWVVGVASFWVSYQLGNDVAGIQFTYAE